MFNPISYEGIKHVTKHNFHRRHHEPNSNFSINKAPTQMTRAGERSAARQQRADPSLSGSGQWGANLPTTNLSTSTTLYAPRPSLETLTVNKWPWRRKSLLISLWRDLRMSAQLYCCTDPRKKVCTWLPEISAWPCLAVA